MGRVVRASREDARRCIWLDTILWSFIRLVFADLWLGRWFCGRAYVESAGHFLVKVVFGIFKCSLSCLNALVVYDLSLVLASPFTEHSTIPTITQDDFYNQSRASRVWAHRICLLQCQQTDLFILHFGLFPSSKSWHYLVGIMFYLWRACISTMPLLHFAMWPRYTSIEHEARLSSFQTEMFSVDSRQDSLRCLRQDGWG
jgi:hypothetical protein